MGGFFYAYQDAEKVRQQGGGWPGESPVLAQRAVADSPRWTRAVEDQSAPIPEETTSELGWTSYIVRRAQLRINQTTLLGASTKLLRPCLGQGASWRAGAGRVRSLVFLSIRLDD